MNKQFMRLASNIENLGRKLREEPITTIIEKDEKERLEQADEILLKIYENNYKIDKVIKKDIKKLVNEKIKNNFD